MYDVKSMKAEEFICHEEIMDTLAYADAHKDDLELVRQILDKAAERKGISHREASVMLACEDEAILEEICKLAEQIKNDFYGNRIVMFAPLYLSNYCVNGCVYCPYHAQNKNSRETWHSTHFDGLHTIRVVSFSGRRFQLQRKSSAGLRHFFGKNKKFRGTKCRGIVFYRLFRSSRSMRRSCSRTAGP